MGDFQRLVKLLRDVAYLIRDLDRDLQYTFDDPAVEKIIDDLGEEALNLLVALQDAAITDAP